MALAVARLELDTGFFKQRKGPSKVSEVPVPMTTKEKLMS